MTRIDKTLPTIPAKRYFKLPELCELAQISENEFIQWQKEHGILGYGSNVFSRQDVIMARRLKATFMPYVDPFTQNFSDAYGNLAITGAEVKQELQKVLGDIEAVLAI